MSRLLSANFSRLWRSKELWLSTAAMLIISIIDTLYFTRIELDRAVHHPIDDYCFELAPYIAAFMGIFIALFLGTEHSDGTLRNKLIVGHTRTNIFLANFLVCLVGSLIITAAWLIGWIPGIILIGPFKMGFSGLAVYCLIIIGITAAYTALFVWVSTISTNKTLTVVFVMILFVSMMLSVKGVNVLLLQPEFTGTLAEVGGEMVLIDEHPNPNYLGGNMRIVLEWFRDLTPMGQADTMSYKPIEHPERGIISSFVTSVIITALGVITFRKKSLK